MGGSAHSPQLRYNGAEQALALSQMERVSRSICVTVCRAIDLGVCVCVVACVCVFLFVGFKHCD